MLVGYNITEQPNFSCLVYLLSLGPGYMFLTKELSYLLVENEIESKEKNKETI